jgi:ADP-heptose:LPS heptosyltransferase
MDSIGDAVLFTAFLGYIKECWPHWHITVVTRNAGAEILTDHPWIDELQVLDLPLPILRVPILKMYWQKRALIKQHMDQWRYEDKCVDLVIIAQESLILNLFAYLVGAPVRLGYATAGGGFWLTQAVEETQNLHETQVQLALIKKINPGSQEAALRVMLPLAPDLLQAMAKKLQFNQKAFLSMKEFLIAINPGASIEGKRWKDERYIDLIRLLVEREKYRIILLGGGEDTSFAQRLVSEISSSAILDLTHKLSVKETAAVIQLSDVFVGVDSMGGHLAAAVGTPGVILFSGFNDYVRWRPLSDRIRLLYREMDCRPCFSAPSCRTRQCMDISANEVAAIVEKIVHERMNLIGMGSQNQEINGRQSPS